MDTCSYVGNSDVYGLGIRVGIYLQWISALISKTFLSQEGLRDVLNDNAIFLLAIFLATVLLVTDTISGVHQVDILIMLHIFFGSIYTIFYDARIRKWIDSVSSFLGIVFKSGTATGMAAIGIWYWFYAINIPENSGCSTYAFLFGRVGLYGSHTIMAFKAFSVLNLFICASVLLTTVSVRLYVWLYRMILLFPDFRIKSIDTESTPYEQSISPKAEARRLRFHHLLYNMLRELGVPPQQDEEFLRSQKQMLEDFERLMARKNKWLGRHFKGLSSVWIFKWSISLLDSYLYDAIVGSALREERPYLLSQVPPDQIAKFASRFGETGQEVFESIYRIYLEKNNEASAWFDKLIPEKYQ